MTFYVGVVLLSVEIFAFIFLTDRIRKQRTETNWKRTVVILWGTGVLLAVGSVFIVYPIGRNYRVHGFPFAAAVFERSGDGWRDYVSPLTPLFTALNAIVFLLLPQFVFAIRLLAKRNRPSL